MAAKMTPQEWVAKLLAAPVPLQGPPILERGTVEVGYELAALSTARALLTVCLDDLQLTSCTAGDRWEAAERRWPGLDDWLGGITGFQFTWADAQVRWLLTGQGPDFDLAIETFEGLADLGGA